MKDGERDGLDFLYSTFLRYPERFAPMSLSMPAARHLLQWMTDNEPQKILDLGSGFSTWLFHAWRQEQDNAPLVITSDKDCFWLAKTFFELADMGLSTNHLYSHRYFVAQIASSFFDQIDMIFCDLARGDSRIEAMNLMDELLAPGGTIFFDDWHCSKMTERMGPLLAELGYEVEILEDTLDQWDRYMAKATKNDD